MIETRDNSLAFSFPEVHPEAKCSIVFQRTLRLPKGKGRYPVPPGLGRFPLVKVEDHEAEVPESWDRRGFFFPMFQSEALWIIFVGWYPFAIKVTAGNFNAVTGKKLHDEGHWRLQDYVVVPRKPWMEWFCIGNGRARQFVAKPIRQRADTGKEEEERLTGQEINIAAYPMRAERYRKYRLRRASLMGSAAGFADSRVDACSDHGWSELSGRSDEEYGTGAWEIVSHSCAAVYPVNSLSFLSITGRRPPGRPPTQEEYADAGLPWLEHYGVDGKAMAVFPLS